MIGILCKNALYIHIYIYVYVCLYSTFTTLKQVLNAEMVYASDVDFIVHISSFIHYLKCG